MEGKSRDFETCSPVEDPDIDSTTAFLSKRFLTRSDKKIIRGAVCEGPQRSLVTERKARRRFQTVTGRVTERPTALENKEQDTHRIQTG